MKKLFFVTVATIIMGATVAGAQLDDSGSFDDLDDFGGFDSYNYFIYDFHSAEEDVVISTGRIIRQYDRHSLSIQQFLDNARILADQEIMRMMENQIADPLAPCDQIAGLSDFFRDVVAMAYEEPAEDEWGAMLINRNGEIDIYRGYLYSDGSPVEVGHRYSGSDAVNIVTILHNHPPQSNALDLLNRYPSSEDWDAAEAIIADGADPSVLTLGVVAPDGEIRMFRYSDRQTFENLSDRSMERGHNLPESIPDDIDTRDCVSMGDAH